MDASGLRYHIKKIRDGPHEHVVSLLLRIFKG